MDECKIEELTEKIKKRIFYSINRRPQDLNLVSEYAFIADRYLRYNKSLCDYEKIHSGSIREVKKRLVGLI